MFKVKKSTIKVNENVHIKFVDYYGYILNEEIKPSTFFFWLNEHVILGS